MLKFFTELIFLQTKYKNQKQKHYNLKNIKTYILDYDVIKNRHNNVDALKGVYNINKGYTQFRQINILYQNEEYALVEQGTSYGLTVYDHIVLNGSAVDEDQIIY